MIIYSRLSKEIYKQRNEYKQQRNTLKMKVLDENFYIFMNKRACVMLIYDDMHAK